MIEQPDSERDREFLKPMLRDLPRSIEPPHDLWPAIAQRIRKPAATRDGRGISRRLAMAAAIFLVALSSFLTWSLTRRSAAPAPAIATVTPSDIEHYARASEELAGALAQNPTALSPETREILMRNLAVIDSAIADCRRAIAADPSNAALQDLLGTAERQRLEFLQQAARLPRS